MRGTKAKVIRKIIYGDFSNKVEDRKYYFKGGTMINDPKGKRYAYQMAKKTFAKVRVG